jgi:hypothetical protein
MVAMTLNSGGLRARLRAAMERLAPVGYQDETGFHYGIQFPPRPTLALTLAPRKPSGSD